MAIQKHKVKLSPRLQLGVGRGQNHRSNLLPYATMIILVISGVLGIRAIKMVATKGAAADTHVQEGAVLGATDTPNQSQLFKDYTVQKGDTVFSIGQKNNIDWTALATINSLEAPFKLKAGQILKIPQQ
jgi:LysM repeat protein